MEIVDDLDNLPSIGRDAFPRRSTSSLADLIELAFSRVVADRGIMLRMRKVEHIEQQINELSAGEFSELRLWILERDWRAWDSQVEADARSGKLDKLIADAQADHAAGRTRPL